MKPSGIILAILIAYFNPLLVNAQCNTGAYWLNGANTAGSLRDTAVVDYFDTVLVVSSNPSSGSYASGRPGYGTPPVEQWGGWDYESVQIYRGGGNGAKTYYKFFQPKDSSVIYFRILNVRGDGIFCSNCEHQRVRGYLNGVAVGKTFKDLQNGTVISGDNFQGGTSTTSSVQSEGRIFFNGSVDSVEIASVSYNDYVIINMYSRCYGILPVTWLGISGTIFNNSIRLNWSTASETGNKQFIIQKLFGNSWTGIGSIKGNGRSNSTLNYSFTDANPINGNNIYRVQQVNFDGSNSFSPVVNLLFVQKATIGIYPNPASDHIQVSNLQGIDKIELISSDGKSIRAYNNKGQSSIRFNLSDLSKGIYYLKLTGNGQDPQIKKIILL